MKHEIVENWGSVSKPSTSWAASSIPMFPLGEYTTIEPWRSAFSQGDVLVTEDEVALVTESGETLVTEKSTGSGWKKDITTIGEDV